MLCSISASKLEPRSVSTHGRSEIWQIEGFMERLTRERKKLATKIRQLRRQAGLTQEQVAELAGVHVSFIGRLEGAKISASLSTLVALSMLFRVELRELFEE